MEKTRRKVFSTVFFGFNPDYPSGNVMINKNIKIKAGSPFNGDLLTCFFCICFL